MYKRQEEVKAKWGKLIEDYLHQSKMLHAVFLLIDIRHAPSNNDRIMYDWILRNGYQPIIIATKLDKIKRSPVSYTHLMVFEYVLAQKGIDKKDVNINQSIDFGSTAAAFSGGQGDYTIRCV